MSVAVGMSQAAHPVGVRSAIDEFDAVIFYARELAQTSGNGATLVFSARQPAPGFVATLYSGRPNGVASMSAADMMPVSSTADITEAALGGVPFTVFFNSAGHVTGIKGAVGTSTALADEPPCPDADHQMLFTFTDGRIQETRTLACRQIIAGAPDIPTPWPTDTPLNVTPTPSASPTTTPTTSPSVIPSASAKPTPTTAPTAIVTNTPTSCPSGEILVNALCLVPAYHPTPTVPPPPMHHVFTGTLTLHASCSAGSGGHCYGWTGMICTTIGACFSSPAATLTAGWAFIIPAADLSQGFYGETNAADWATLTVSSAPKDPSSALHVKVSGGTLSLQNFFNARNSGAMERCEVYVQPFILWLEGSRTASPDFPNILYAYTKYYPSSTFVSASKTTEHIAPATAPYWSIESGTVGANGALHQGQLDWYEPTLGTGRYAPGFYYWIKDRQCRYGNGDWKWALKNFSVEVWQSQ